MKVLFLDAYFEPEKIAFTHLEKDLISGLVSADNRIVIICPSPTRDVDPEVVNYYKNKKTEELYAGYVHVKRFSSPHERRNPLVRAFRYIWGNLRTYQLGKKEKDIDVVFCNSTPPTQGWIAGKVAKKLGVPLVYSLQDVFPDSLITTGLSSKGSLLWKIGRKLENKTYQECRQIIAISASIKRNIMAKGVPAEKITVVSNWVDLDTVTPIKRSDNRLFDEFGINRSQFIVVYAGNLGEAQGADVIIDTAKKLTINKEIKFVIFGGGARYQEIKNRIISEKINNIFITCLQPQERVPEVYSMGNVALITCKPGTGNTGMPSKTWNIMACNTTIIASFDIDSDMTEVICDAGAGFCVEPGNADELAKAIESVFQDWKQGKVNTRDIRSYALKNASKETCVQKYIDTLRNAARMR